MHPRHDREHQVSDKPPVTSSSGEGHVDHSKNSSSLPRSEARGDNRPAHDLIAPGGIQILWEDRWHEEEIFANRLSFYILTQSFLMFVAVVATLSSDATSRWLPVAVTIDLVGLILTIVFWYALTENLRKLDALREIVAEGSSEIDVRGYLEIGAVRTAHHEQRAQRGLPLPLSILPGLPPSWWLAHGVPVLLGATWIVLLSVAIATGA